MNLSTWKKIGMLAVVILLSVVLLTGCQPAEEETSEELTKLRLGAVPGENIEARREEYVPFVEYLERKLDMEVELFVGTDYTATIEAMRAGKLDIAWYGPFSYVLAADIANAEAFAAGYREDDGIYYESYIITHPDSGINDITDLKGKTFAFVDPASTGGYLIPLMHMVEAGIDPEKDLASTVFLGGHDACALAIKNKNVDASTIVKHMYKKALQKGLIVEEDVKIIHVSDPFPGGPLAWRKDLHGDIKEKLLDAILNIPEEEYDKLKDCLEGVVRFEAVDDSTWDILRKAAEVLNLDIEELA